jgi:hypothetical protein
MVKDAIRDQLASFLEPPVPSRQKRCSRCMLASTRATSAAVAFWVCPATWLAVAASAKRAVMADFMNIVNKI